MGRLLLLVIVVCYTFQVNAQEITPYIISKDSTILSPSDSLLTQHLLPGNQHLLDNKIDPFHFGVEVGTSVSVDFSGAYGTNLYVAPQLSFIPNKKWQIHLTPVIARSTFHDMPVWIYPNYATTASGTINRVGLYAQGIYNINEKLYVGATLRTETLMFDQNSSTMPIQNLNNIGASALVGYKFSENFRIQAEFGVNRNPNYNSNFIGLPANTFITPTKNPYDTF